MSVTVVEAGKRRTLRPEDLEAMLALHPERIAVEARAAFTGQELTVRAGEVPRALMAALQEAARRVVPAALSEEAPAETRGVDPEVSLIAETTDLPVYQFIPPPAGLTAADPAELAAAGATRTCSAYREAPLSLMKRGNRALAALARLRYRVPEGEARTEQMDAMARLLTTVAAAARSFPMMTVRPVQRYLALVPGELPGVVSQTLDGFVRSIRPLEALNVPLFNRVGQCLGHPKRTPQDAPTLEGVTAFYTGIQEKLWPLAQEMPGVRDRLLAGEDVGWWLEGESLSRPVAPHAGDLSKGAGQHLIVPGLGPRHVAPPPFPTLLPPAGGAPIVLTVSDLHLGQGAWDNADEGYTELEGALVAMLDAWSERVRQHRAIYGIQPAYFVLNGDVLDFWSADLQELAGGGDRFQLDVENDNGTPRLTPAVSSGRMRRILAAHADFFRRITRWVDEDRLNFVVYVCGNHDDHLVRFGLGGALARELHPTRGAFAAQSLHFPDLCTIIEHGHRTDVFNAWQGAGTDVGMYGSLGEILVATMINPAERGGAGALTMMEATFNPFLDAQGIDTDFLDDLGKIYGHFRRCYQVDPSVYEGCMGCIDNIDSGGLEEAVADYTGRELVERNRTRADDADVADLDDDLLDLKNIWVKSDLQDLAKRFLAPSLSHLLPPSTQAWLVDKVFAGDHARKLGFVPDLGLFGDPTRRIHLVGHTHKPEATSPPIDGRQVWAQHVNTGTGQDTWTPVDDNKRDNLDLEPLLPGGPLWGAVEESEDELKPVAKSNYCILQVMPVLAQPIVWRMAIEAGEFRTAQTHRPEDTPRAVRGGLMAKGTNSTILD
jgi:hypothetical protein